MLKFLLLYEIFIPSVKLCAFEEFQWLNDHGFLSFKASQISRVNKQQCLECDVLILVRGATVLEELVAKNLKKAGKYIIYVLDDDILNIPLQSISYPFLSRDTVKKRIKRIMLMSDLLISPSRRLIEKYSVYFSKGIRIEEPCLHLKSHNLLVEKSKVLRIGFAGTIDRREEIVKLIYPVLYNLKNKYKDKIEIEIIGIKIDFEKELDIRWFPYQKNYKCYQQLMEERNWDIGLSPLTDSEFNRFKYYNKYIEYGGFGIVGIYSKVPPYTDIIRNRENGILCQNTQEEWISVLDEIISNRNQLDIYKNTILNDMTSRFALENISYRLWGEIQSIDMKRKNSNHFFSLKLIKVVGLVIRSLEYIQRNGIKTGKELWNRRMIKKDNNDEI